MTRSDEGRSVLMVHDGDYRQGREDLDLTSREDISPGHNNSGTEKPACKECDQVDWKAPPPRTCQGCEATVCLRHSGQVEAVRVMEASERYLDDALYVKHVDGKAHAHLLLNSATLRGQQAAVYLKSCPSGSVVVESTEMAKVPSAGDGNCAFYSVCNGLNTIANKPTGDAYPTQVVQALKSAVANALVEHVTVGQARGLDQLMDQCSDQNGGRPLHLLQGARARMMGLDVLDSPDNKQKLSLFRDELLHDFFRDHQYLPLGMMGALAQAIDTNIVVWVQHPTSPDKLIVHREKQGNYLSVHAPVGATHTIHLHFHNSSNPEDADVYRWAAGSSGHFQLLVPRPAQGGGGEGCVDDSTATAAAAAAVRTHWYSRLARMLVYWSDVARLTMLIYEKIVSSRNGPGSGKRGCAIKVKGSPEPEPADDDGLPAGDSGGGLSEDKKKEEAAASAEGQDNGGLLTLCTSCLETVKMPNRQTIENESNIPPSATAPPAAANLSAAVSDAASVPGAHPARGGSIITPTPPSSPPTCSSLGGPVSSSKSTSVPIPGCEGEGEELPRTGKSGFFRRSLPKMAGAMAVIGVAATVGAMVLGRRR